MGLESCGTHGTTAALALLTDSVKKGGVMACSNAGGLSGAFVPVSEDSGMTEAVKKGAISIDKLEAMTSVSSVGLDMIAIPGDTPAETIAAIIAFAIGSIIGGTIVYITKSSFIFILGLIGVPATGGFLGKLLVFQSGMTVSTAGGVALASSSQGTVPSPLAIMCLFCQPYSSGGIRRA
jgi:uncharacterized protein (UPF0210 family)